MEEAIDYAHSKGVVIIAAAGNSGESSASYPARYPHVIGVSAPWLTTKKLVIPTSARELTFPPPVVLKWENSPKYDRPINWRRNFCRLPRDQHGISPRCRRCCVGESFWYYGTRRNSQRTFCNRRELSARFPANDFGAGNLDAAAAVQLAQRGQINFRDFFRWLRDNGYLSPRFWIDGGAVALLPKDPTGL